MPQVRKERGKAKINAIVFFLTRRLGWVSSGFGMVDWNWDGGLDFAALVGAVVGPVEAH